MEPALFRSVHCLFLADVSVLYKVINYIISRVSRSRRYTRYHRTLVEKNYISFKVLVKFVIS